MNSGVTLFIFTSLIILISCFPGHVTAAVVTLHSIELYKTHEWLSKPTVYFQCKGENKTILPDVKKTKVVYTFKGEESWQPLTNFTNKKCKRCGLYEKDFLQHDTFDEWEFCPSDFGGDIGTYTLLKEKEFHATFLCPECLDLMSDHKASPPPPLSYSGKKSGKKGLHVLVVLAIFAAVAAVVIIGFVGGYKYYQKRKRQQEQARFLKLFEEHDDMEDELGLEEMI